MMTIVNEPTPLDIFEKFEVALNAAIVTCMESLTPVNAALCDGVPVATEQEEQCLRAMDALQGAVEEFRGTLPKIVEKWNVSLS